MFMFGKVFDVHLVNCLFTVCLFVNTTQCVVDLLTELHACFILAELMQNIEKECIALMLKLNFRSINKKQVNISVPPSSYFLI